ncbi:hypothetical protein EUGRSUZ_K02397 [Eucalyptus grandis]|uniref:Uncharacterized protein n=2 Tax=Eucalyptus grandis TaxID=71139 RepID=A0ACC3IWD5_EUCGR|nr:hypothetical protein EUGRSUZ_K02397 [Eucalyptus grandis]
MKQRAQSQMKHAMCQGHAGTHPSTCSKRNELVVLTLIIQLRSNEPLRLKSHRVFPDIWVSTDRPTVHKDLCVFGYVIAHENGVGHGLPGHEEWEWRVEPEGLLHNCLQVGELVYIGFLDLSVGPNNPGQLCLDLGHGVRFP